MYPEIAEMTPIYKPSRACAPGSLHTYTTSWLSVKPLKRVALHLVYAPMSSKYNQSPTSRSSGKVLDEEMMSMPSQVGPQMEYSIWDGVS